MRKQIAISVWIVLVGLATYARADSSSDTVQIVCTKEKMDLSLSFWGDAISDSERAEGWRYAVDLIDEPISCEVGDQIATVSVHWTKRTSGPCSATGGFGSVSLVLSDKNTDEKISTMSWHVGQDQCEPSFVRNIQVLPTAYKLCTRPVGTAYADRNDCVEIRR